MTADLATSNCARLAEQIRAGITIEPNNPERRGLMASKPYFWGKSDRPRPGLRSNPRYWIAAIHTRFDAVTFFVFDLDMHNEQGDVVIRQEATIEAAIAGLC